MAGYTGDLNFGLADKNAVVKHLGRQGPLLASIIIESSERKCPPGKGFARQTDVDSGRQNPVRRTSIYPSKTGTARQCFLGLSSTALGTARMYIKHVRGGGCGLLSDKVAQLLAQLTLEKAVFPAQLY
jgi:hypothetical protein